MPARQLAITGSQTYAKAYVQSLRHAASGQITMKELCSFRWQFRCSAVDMSVLVWVCHPSTHLLPALQHDSTHASAGSSSAPAHSLLSMTHTGTRRARR